MMPKFPDQIDPLSASLRSAPLPRSTGERIRRPQAWLPSSPLTKWGRGVEAKPRRRGGTLTAILSLAACLGALTACQSGGHGGGADNSAAVALLQRVNDNAHTCWIRSKDKDFDSYGVIPELDTSAGKPRILVVDKKAAHGLPKLVIEAGGKPVKAAAYGPLLSEPAGGRISADLKRWAGGSNACTA